LGYKLAEHPRDLTRDQILFLTASLVHRMSLKQNASLAGAGVTRIVVSDSEEEAE
jgi:hypothetical protein